MRITGGMFRGRQLQRPAGPDVRPTQDRVREALFSALAARVPGCAFLDLYAGTGAVGLEAWSRGARRICWVEASPRVFRGLKAQIQACPDAAEGVLLEPVCMDAEAFCGRHMRGAGAGFDVVYADPPYAQQDAARLMEGLGTHGWLGPGGVLVLEQAADTPLPTVTGWHVLRDKRYGGSRLRMFRKEEQR